MRTIHGGIVNETDRRPGGLYEGPNTIHVAPGYEYAHGRPCKCCGVPVEFWKNGVCLRCNVIKKPNN